MKLRIIKESGAVPCYLVQRKGFFLWGPAIGHDVLAKNLGSTFDQYWYPIRFLSLKEAEEAIEKYLNYQKANKTVIKTLEYK